MAAQKRSSLLPFLSALLRSREVLGEGTKARQAVEEHIEALQKNPGDRCDLGVLDLALGEIYEAEYSEEFAAKCQLADSLLAEEGIETFGFGVCILCSELDVLNSS